MNDLVPVQDRWHWVLEPCLNAHVPGGGGTDELNACRNSHMNRKILMICDDPAKGALVERMVGKERGDKVTSISCDQQVLKVERELPDIILIDATMAEVDVFQVYRQLRANPALQTTPVLFWSVPNTRYMYPRAQEIGAAGCLEFMASYNKDDLLTALDVIGEGGSYYPSLD
jgi:CheY-like chemotaxis protein